MWSVPHHPCAHMDGSQRSKKQTQYLYPLPTIGPVPIKQNSLC